jgi:hypothetical protein
MKVIVILLILLLVWQSNQFTNQIIDAYGSHTNQSKECTDEDCDDLLSARSSKGDFDIKNVKNNNYSISLLNHPGTTINYSTSLSNNIKRVNLELSSFDNNVYVVWEEGSYGKSYIVLKKSNDSGVTFSAPVNITSPAIVSDYFVHPDPDIAVSGNDVYIVWKDSNSGIFFKKSEDKGETFGGKIRLDEDNSIRGIISDLHISAFGNNVYIVWKDSNSGIFFKKSEDKGVTYYPITLLTDRTNVSHLKMVASTNNNVHLAWQDVVSGDYSIFYKRSKDGGKSFGEVIKLNIRSEDSFEPDVTTANSKNVFVVWKSANTGILLRSSMDRGASFSSPILLSNATNVSDLKITAVGTHVYVVWKSSTIILKASSNSGNAFNRGINVANIINNQPTELNLYGATRIEVSSIAKDRLFVTWMQPEISVRDESRSIYSDIFFLKLN